MRIYLLGPMRIERDAVAIHLPRRKVESLLAYLLLHPEQQSRDHLATLLWGDTSDIQARQSLRTALATVRKQISPDLLHTDRDHVQLNPTFPLWIDLHTLLALEVGSDPINEDWLQAHLALWQDELLAGFYDDWIAREREVYRARLLERFLHVAQTLRAQSDYRQAIAVAQHILTHEPAHEQAHQHIMFCYVAAGDRPAALRQYAVCEKALRDDLDALPLPATTALYQWIKQYDEAENPHAAKITNLPLPFSSFVGRTRETVEIKRLLAPATTSRIHQTAHPNGVRLLTLTGAGGSGKTRLAIQVATDLIDRYAHGVWWVELAALASGAGDDGVQVARAVAKVLGVREVMGQPLTESVASFVGDRHLLLVLDNCEHLVAPCAHLAAALLAQCPHLQILATSREALNIAGEALWQVPPFAVPDPTHLALVDSLLQYESMRLFAERASAVQLAFALTPQNAAAVAEICRQLDGIPLAIELAAARVKVLAVEEIAARLTTTLGARFTLLTQGSRAALPRQQTLRATLDWSYALLTEAEQLLFRQVAIFRDGFALEAIEALVASASNSRPASTTLDLLTQLVDKSLVIVEPQAGERRYRLLETLREYALEQIATPAALASLQQAHAQYFLRWAEAAAPQLLGAQQHTWFVRMEADHANLAAAIDYLLAAAESEQALRLVAAIFRFWEARGYVSEGREWLRKALAQRAAATPLTQARALRAAGTLAWRQSDFDGARPLLEESLAFFMQYEEETGMAETLQSLAAVNMSQGEYAIAQTRLEQSLALCRSLHDDYGLARALNHLGNLAIDQDRYPEARAFYQESLHLYQTLGDQVSIATSFFNLGNAARQLGDFEAARANYEACLNLSRTLGHRGLIGVTLRNLGIVALDQQEFTQARHYSEEALNILRDLGDRGNMAFVLSTLGNVARHQGNLQQALAHYTHKLQLLHAVGHKWGTFYALEEIAHLLIEAAAQREWTVQLLGAAHTLRQETNLPVPDEEQADYDRRVNDLRHLLGASTFDALWQEGQSTPLAHIVVGASALALA